jgi:hypothetical protein
VGQDLSPGAVAGEFLQRQGSPGDVLRQGLSGRVIAAFQMHGGDVLVASLARGRDILYNCGAFASYLRRKQLDTSDEM